jgi:hypothetical protein
MLRTRLLKFSASVLVLSGFAACQFDCSNQRPATVKVETLPLKTASKEIKESSATTTNLKLRLEGKDGGIVEIENSALELTRMEDAQTSHTLKIHPAKIDKTSPSTLAGSTWILNIEDVRLTIQLSQSEMTLSLACLATIDSSKVPVLESKEPFRVPIVLDGTKVRLATAKSFEMRVMSKRDENVQCRILVDAPFLDFSDPKHEGVLKVGEGIILIKLENHTLPRAPTN